MKSGYFIIILFLPAILYFSACTTAYIPPELNTPGFHDANEFRGGLSYGSSGTNLQLAYSFHKHIGMTFDAAYLRAFGSEPRLQRNWGMGLGYFTPLHKDKTVYLEVFSGFHISETRSAYTDNDFTAGPGYENSQYHSFYIQPDISFPFTNGDLIFSGRLSYFNFTKYETHKLQQPELPKAFGFEPAITVRVGSKNLKFKSQIGTSFMGLLDGHEFNSTYIFVHFGFDVSF